MDERWVQRKEKRSLFFRGIGKDQFNKKGIVSCKADDVISVGKNTVRDCKGTRGFEKTKFFGKKFLEKGFR